MTRNIWEFLGKPDGTYAVSHNGKLLSDPSPKSGSRVRLASTMGFAAGNTKRFAGNWIALGNARLT